MRTSTLSTLSFILLLGGCASSGGFENTRYDSYWKDDKRPNPQTLLACAEYARVSASYSTQGYEAPPMNQVVVMAPTSPTEYEGEITSCGITSCTVELRETRRSAMSRQFRETTNSMSQDYYQAGYAIGAAIRRSNERAKLEAAVEKANNECLASAGYEQLSRRYVDVFANVRTCETLDGTNAKDVGTAADKIGLVFRNYTKTPVDIRFVQPSGRRTHSTTVEPYQRINYTTVRGHVWEIANAATGTCMSKIKIDDEPALTVVSFRSKS